MFVDIILLVAFLAGIAYFYQKKKKVEDEETFEKRSN